MISLWRFVQDLHRSVSINLRVAGHTKVAPDWCFGLLKWQYRRSETSCLNNLIQPKLTNLTELLI